VVPDGEEMVLLTFRSGPDGPYVTCSHHDTVVPDNVPPSDQLGEEPLGGKWWEIVSGWSSRRAEGDLSRSEEGELAAVVSELLPGRVTGMLADLMGSLGRRITLGIHVAAEADQRLWDLPWDLLWVQSPGDLRRTGIAVAQVVDLDARTPATAEGPFRALVCIGPRLVPRAGYADPVGADVSLGEELGFIDEVTLLSPLVNPDLNEFEQSLTRQASAGPLIDLLVFDGHGDVDGLWLAGPDGRGEAKIAPGVLAKIAGPSVRVALLVACWAGAGRSGDGPAVEHWEGVAQALARRGVVTIAFPSPLTAQEGSDFVRRFAAGLRAGRSVTEATMNPGGPAAVVWLPGPVSARLRTANRPSNAGPRRVLTDGSLRYDHMVERPGVTTAIREAIRPPQGSEHGRIRLIELVGATGSGKSTLLRSLENDPIVACALLRDPALTQRDPLTAAVLCARLGHELARRAERLDEWHDDREQLKREDSGWTSLVVERASQEGSPEAVAVLIDGLDEADEAFVRFLEQHVHELPAWIVFVCASRSPVSHLGLAEESRITVDLNDHQDVEAVSEYVRWLLEPAVRAGTVSDDVARVLGPNIAAEARGNFLAARTTTDVLARHALAPRSPTGELSGSAMPAPHSVASIPIDGPWTAFAFRADCFLLDAVDGFIRTRVIGTGVERGSVPLPGTVRGIAVTSASEAMVVDLGGEIAVATIDNNGALEIWARRFATHGGRVLAAQAHGQAWLTVLLDVAGHLAELRLARGVEHELNALGIALRGDATYARGGLFTGSDLGDSPAPESLGRCYSIDAATNGSAWLTAELRVDGDRTHLRACRSTTSGDEFGSATLLLNAARVVVARPMQLQIPQRIVVAEGGMARVFSWTDLASHRDVQG
jgi:hypothetical protein